MPDRSFLRRIFETAEGREKLLGFVAQNGFEIVSILIAAAALVYAVLAFNASKQAISASREANIAALQVKAQDGISDARRSFLSLQEACLLTRREWDNHKSKHFPAFGSQAGYSMFAEPEETQHIRKIELVGSKALEELLASTPKSGSSDSSEWHEFIARAQSVSTSIGRLKLSLEGPKPFPH